MEKLKKLPRKISKLLENRLIQAIFGVACLLLAYLFASLAIDSGSLLDYLITLLLIFAGLREISIAIFVKRKR